MMEDLTEQTRKGMFYIMRRIQKISKKSMVYFFMTSIIMNMGCEKYLPGTYQEEDFFIAFLDEKACEYLTRPLVRTDTVIVPIDTLFIDDSVVVVYDTSFTYDTMYVAGTASILADLVDSVWVDSSESVIIRAFFDSLSAALDTLLADTVMRISYPDEGDTIYAFYDHRAIQAQVSIRGHESGDTYFFIGWNLTNKNKDGFIDVDLIRSDGSVVKEKTTIIPLETVAGCTGTLELVAGTKEIVSVIRIRPVFELDKAPYIVRFLISQPTEIGPFRVAIFWAGERLNN